MILEMRITKQLRRYLQVYTTTYVGVYNCGVENAEETPGILRVAGGFEPLSLVFASFNPDTVC